MKKQRASDLEEGSSKEEIEQKKRNESYNANTADLEATANRVSGKQNSGRKIMFHGMLWGPRRRGQSLIPR